jgi:uncharacterized protein
MKLNHSIKDADFLVDYLELEPHPEGGYFKETYRSKDVIPQSALGAAFSEDHVFSTAIYFLLKSGQVSKFHKIKQDEMWHFYFGSPLRVLFLEDNGNIEEFTLSPEIKSGHVFQALMPANTWIAAYPLEEDSFTLVGCTVSPGFEFSDFTMADRDEMIKKFPQHRELIKNLT